MSSLLTYYTFFLYDDLAAPSQIVINNLHLLTILQIGRA